MKTTESHSQIRRISTLCTLAASLLVAACSSTSESTDDTISATSTLGQSSDVSHVHRLGGIHAMDGAIDMPLLGAGSRALRCDSSPELTTTTVCGATLPASAHYEWTSCAPPPPKDGEQRPPPPPDGEQRPPPPKDHGKATGTADITTSYTVDPEASCDPTSLITATRTATFSFSRGGPDGRGMKETGTVISTSSRTLENATNYTETNEVDTTRTRTTEDGSEESIHLTGTVTVAFEGADDSLKRTFNGTLTSTFSDGSSRVVAMTGVVRVAPETCFWPIAGTVARTEADGSTHTLVFSDTCGQATLDGETITLKDRGGPGHGPREGGPGNGPRHGGPGCEKRE